MKSSWNALKASWNAKNVPVIPPFYVSNELITDLEAEINIFNAYFANQCTPINSNNQVPSNLKCLTNDQRL